MSSIENAIGTPPSTGYYVPDQITLGGIACFGPDVEVHEDFEIYAPEVFYVDVDKAEQVIHHLSRAVAYVRRGQAERGVK